MSRFLLAFLAFGLYCVAWADQGSDFNKRFSLVKDDAGKTIAVRLKLGTTKFSIKPLIEQIKADLEHEQTMARSKAAYEYEQEIDDMMEELGYNPYMLVEQDSEEAMRFKESLLNLKNIDINKTFAKLDVTSFWQNFETKINEAILIMDPTVVANLNDPKFFFKRQVLYSVITQALEQAKKVFSDVPALNIASFIIVRVHEMIQEQRYFHHSMLMHYFENMPEEKLGMTKAEIDVAMSSLYESRIAMTNVLESNSAAKDWANYGMKKFFMQVREGSKRAEMLKGRGLAQAKRLNFAFIEGSDKAGKKIFHLFVNAHQFSQSPALAYDYANPNKVRRMRMLCVLGGAGLGFVQMPGWLKSRVEDFINSLYVSQVRMEGALVGYFDTKGDKDLKARIFSQRANFYIVE